ncbi:MAG: hypothetical protein FJX76_03175 [Armatimonadetes bacterium]|nr:hypothetical protein [Armatimonadota bacterium]
MPEIPVIVSAEARAQIDEIDVWWMTNRRSSPDLFWQELEEGIGLLSRLPRVGHPYSYPGLPGLRRLLLRSSRYHLYYRASDEAVTVLAVWSAVRGRPPQF